MGDDLEFCIWLLCSSAYPTNLLASLSVEGCKRIKEGRKKTRVPYNSKLYFGGHDYSVARALSKTNRSSRVFQTRCWNMSLIFGSKSLKFIVYPVGVFSETFLAEAAVKITHNPPLSPGLSEHVCYPDSSREKEVLSISVRENFSLIPESLSFRHVWFSFPVGGFPGTTTFFEFIYSIFIICFNYIYIMFRKQNN